MNPDLLNINTSHRGQLETARRVGRADGGEATLFRDQRQGCWFRQAP